MYNKFHDIPAGFILNRYRKGMSAPIISEMMKIPVRRIYRLLKYYRVDRRNRVSQHQTYFHQTSSSFDFFDSAIGKDRELLLAGTMIYLAKGAKTGSVVDFASSEIGSHKIFINFLRKICRVDENRLHYYLYCFSDKSAEELKTFWSQELALASGKFLKPYIRKTSGLEKKMPFGLLHVRYNDKRLLEKILNLCSSILAQLT